MKSPTEGRGVEFDELYRLNQMIADVLKRVDRPSESELSIAGLAEVVVVKVERKLLDVLEERDRARRELDEQNERLQHFADSLVLQLDASHEPTPLQTVCFLASEACRDSTNSMHGVEDLREALHEALQLALKHIDAYSTSKLEQLAALNDTLEGWGGERAKVDDDAGAQVIAIWKDVIGRRA